MATAVNDVTGKVMKTGTTTSEFSKGYDLIWGKKPQKTEEQQSTTEKLVIEEKAALAK